MAPRGRSAIAGEAADRSYESSPDPLAVSVNETNSRSTRKTTQNKPLTTTSPSKQNRRLSVSELGFSSPSKSLVMDTPRLGNASPWRIKVTVQAEPGSDEENVRSPSVKRITRTKTTTVPLKDPDAQSPVKRPRGRPRKSDVGAVTKPKRSGTPVRRAARSKSRESSAAARETSVADVDTDVPPKKRRGRPRKSIQAPIEDEETEDLQEPELQDEASFGIPPLPSTDPQGPVSERSTRLATPKNPSPVATTTNATLQAASPKGHQGETHDDASHILPNVGNSKRTLTGQDVSVASTPSRMELGKSLRARKGTPYSKKTTAHIVLSDEESDEHSDMLTPSSGDDDELPRQPPKVSEENSDKAPVQEDRAAAMTPQVSEHDEDDDIQDITNFAFDEGATRMPDDTTILDSENFSMISVDSLPSSGGLSSPPKPEDLQNALPSSIESILQNGSLNPNESIFRDASQVMSGVPSMSRRYKTPVNDVEVPSVPPAIELVQPTVAKNETPKLGRAVTAGVALQGVLEPARLTPEPSQRALDEKRDRLDDLFRGFSEGTRKELQAGLRLGEQLAEFQRDEKPSPSPSLALSSSTKAQPHATRKEGVFRTQRKYRHSRLLTPDEQDHHVITPTEPSIDSNEVHYPSLNVAEVENQLLSPARSEDEMSWRVDTPPVTITDTAPRPILPAEAAINLAGHMQHDDYSDIWQEEASRSSNSPEADRSTVEKSPHEEDLFADDGPSRPTRGKLPKTWRRKSTNNFHYSDEAESPQQPEMTRTRSTQPVSDVLDTSKANVVENSSAKYAEDDDDDDHASDASDDTGMFFQSNMPSIFNKKRSAELRQKKADKLNLSLLLNEGESLAPESSPPAAATRSSSTVEINPFVDTPPRFSGFPSSPKKGSPLRQEVRGSDISSDSPRHFADESTLPLPQSSPFHTYVDGESILSVASDQRQFRAEMEGSTASSIRRLRSEANQYLDAYEPQERSLNEIEEVTEPSRTWYQETSVMASSPPQRKQTFAQSMLSPTRKPVPLFSNHQEQYESVTGKATQTADEADAEESDDTSGSDKTNPSLTATSQSNVTTPAQEPQQATSGLLRRATSTVLGTISRPAAPTPHPILSRFTLLPKVEPWTKTHYKTLDKLYSAHLKHPALFSPSIVPATPLSQTNAHLLDEFLLANKKPYVGATFSAWGYSMMMSEELVILCAVYVQLLALRDIKEYEAVSGKEIQLGDCAPGKRGDIISGEEVARRLATVVMGEAVRRDEKMGKKIDRRGALTVQWPQ